MPIFYEYPVSGARSTESKVMSEIRSNAGSANVPGNHRSAIVEGIWPALQKAKTEAEILGLAIRKSWCVEKVLSPNG
jgi:hypothetical protein